MKFKNLLTEEQRQKLDRVKFKETREKQELDRLTDSELAQRLQYYMTNSFGLRRIADEYRDSPVYDSVIWFVLLPEVIRRLHE